MADSVAEAILKALEAALEAAKPSGARVLRNEILPERIPAAGLIILRDGSPGDAEALMSPPYYYYEHRAEVDVVVDRPASSRDSTFDALKQAVGTAVAADRTLGGRCDYVVGESPTPLMVPIEGAEGFKAATIGVVLMYGSPDPLS